MPIRITVARPIASPAGASALESAAGGAVIAIRARQR
jgi:hypothetical protein